MIQIDAFSHKYKTVELTFKSLIFEKGITIIRGNNGCGKSTLFKKISGLLDQNPMFGDFIYLPEKPSMPLNIKVIKYLNALNTLSKTSLNQIDKFLTMFHLDKKRDYPLIKLSKGMHQKVALIGVLNERRSIYLLDEPFNGLDKETLKNVVNYIENINGYIIITTHEPIHFNKGFKEIYL